MRTILVVDDEPKIVQLARDYLEHAGFAVVTAHDGKAALASARGQRPDLVVLDLGLPELDGLDVARTLRAESNVPIVMLTGRSEESDKLVGLELGADDYVTKPFSPKELVARVRAVLRRLERPRLSSELVAVGDVRLDIPRMRVTRSDRAVPSSPRMGRRIVADAWRLRAPDGAVLCRRSRPLDLRRDLPLLDARDRARVSRSAGRNRARRRTSIAAASDRIHRPGGTPTRRAGR